MSGLSKSTAKPQGWLFPMSKVHRADKTPQDQANTFISFSYTCFQDKMLSVYPWCGRGQGMVGWRCQGQKEARMSPEPPLSLNRSRSMTLAQAESLPQTPTLIIS